MAIALLGALSISCGAGTKDPKAPAATTAANGSGTGPGAPGGGGSSGPTSEGAPASEQVAEGPAEAEEEEYEPPVDLVVRAAPLVDLLQRAVAAKADVVWEGKGK